MKELLTNFLEWAAENVSDAHQIYDNGESVVERYLSENTIPDAIGWISVDDDLPDENCMCIVKSPTDFPKNYRGRIAEYYSDNGEFYCESSEHAITNVTHWMLAPSDAI